MDNRWDNIGNQLRHTVDDAIRRSDFTDLSRNIHNMMNNAMGPGAMGRPGGMGGPMPGGPHGTPPGGIHVNPPGGIHVNMPGTPPGGARVNQPGGARMNQPGGARTGQPGGPRPGTMGPGPQPRPRVTPVVPVRLYDRRPRYRIRGITMGVFGGIGIILFGILFIGFVLLFIPIASIVFAVITALFIWLAVSGAKKTRFSGRYQSYIDVIQDRVTVPVQELAARVEKTPDFVMRDLQRMIDKKMFYQAHIDRDDLCFILSDEAYETYQEAKKEYAERQRQAKEEADRKARQEQEAAAKNGQLPPECQKLIAEGEEYIRYIHESNDRIPGEEISAKLDHMERIITRIFETVRLHPEVADDLNKLMSYYLPTTKKLLNTYQELDYHTISGENISSTKAEIEDAVDALNKAFEKLLDGLYESRAWDVSSDISVLKTVLAQDGLQDDGLHSVKNA